MKNKTVIFLLLCTIVVLIIGVVLFKVNKDNKKNKIEIWTILDFYTLLILLFDFRTGSEVKRCVCSSSMVILC